MKYFDTLYKNMPSQVELEAPALLREVAIIKDTVDNEILLRNSFVNISDQKIIAMSIHISLKDIFGEAITNKEKGSYSYVYQDVDFEPNTIFGNKIPIVLPSEARKAEIRLEKVVLADGTVWSSNPDNIVFQQVQREIEASDEFIGGMDDNSIIPIFYYVENESCWQCTCGQPNKLNATTCSNCKREKDYVKENYNKECVVQRYQVFSEEMAEQRRLEEVKIEKERTLAKEQEEKLKILEEERRKEEERNKLEKQRKKRKIGFVACGITLVIAVCVFTAFTVLPADKRAVKALEKSLEARDKVGELSSEEDYRNVLKLETDVLSYKGKWFRDKDIEEYFELYVEGVECQEEALDYFETDDSKCSLMWEKGCKESSIAVIYLQSLGAINLEKELYGSHAAEVLENNIVIAAGGKITLQADVSGQYYIPLEIMNPTLANFKNLKVEVWWNEKKVEVKTDVWKAISKRTIDIPIPNYLVEDLSQVLNFYVSIEDYEVESLREQS